MTTATTAPSALSAIDAALAQYVTDATVRYVTASTDGAQTLARPDRRFTDADDAAPVVGRRAVRDLTVTRCANMIGHRVGRSADDVLAHFRVTGSRSRFANREMTDALAAVHHVAGEDVRIRQANARNILGIA